MNLPQEVLIQSIRSRRDVLTSCKLRNRLLGWLIPATGLLSLTWFLIRVIPKPSRATYPCQRVAFPMASGFVAWLSGAIGSAVAFRGAKYHFARARYVVGAICVAASIGGVCAALGGVDEQIVLADDPMPNDPIGVARGIHPGRVVWVHDPDATDWDGPDMGDGHWWESANTNMAVVDRMMRRSIQALAGESSGAEAWDKIFRYFNQTQGKGDVGYQEGEKITIKVNLVGCIGVWSGSGVDPATYDLVRNMDYMNTAPQMMLALLRQLVHVVGVNQADISIGDTLCYFPNQFYYMCHDEFPDVRYLDYEGRFGRTPVQASSIPLYWSNHTSGVSQDYIPESYARAEYIINMANFKSHTMAAVTFCAKNHYGSLIRWPGQAGYYDLHNDLPSARDGMGHYRNLVDLMGHAHIGGKTLLYMIDGLYAGHHPTDGWPTRLNSVPFDGDWSSSLFVSQDPVAIDSVAFDFLWAEPGWDGTTQMSGGEDYLHEAALADNPQSGAFYDPDHSGDVARLASLGVHEHWNNPLDREYSRNLGTGDGIELISYGPGQNSPVLRVEPFEMSGGCDTPQLSVAIVIEDVTDLHNVSLDLTFDPECFSVTGCTEGFFLGQVGPTVFVPDIDNTSGRANIITGLLGADEGPSGCGVIANCTVDVLDWGAVPTSLCFQDIALEDHLANPIVATPECGLITHPRKGDVDGSGYIDHVDLFDFVFAWGLMCADAGYCSIKDYNDDCYVDYKDLFDFVFDWHTGVRVASPDGGEVCNGTEEVTWEGGSIADEPLVVDLYASTDGGACWHQVVADEPDDGSYMWDTTAWPDSAECKLKIVAHNESELYEDESDGVFTISNPGSSAAVSSLRMEEEGKGKASKHEP